LPVITPNTTTPKCFNCGSDLIVVKVETEKTDSSYSQTVVTTYRCSNDECQKDTEKKNAERIEKAQVQAADKADREKKRLASMRAGRKRK